MSKVGFKWLLSHKGIILLMLPLLPLICMGLAGAFDVHQHFMALCIC